MPDTNLQYWTGTGWSSPSLCSVALRAAGVGARPAYAAAGLPGAMKKMANVRTLTTHRTTTAPSKRRNTKAVIGNWTGGCSRPLGHASLGHGPYWFTPMSWKS